jgi:hypothetical protein
MFITKLKVNAAKTISLAILLCTVFSGESSSAVTVFKHYNNPVVRKIKCPTDYSMGSLHVVPVNMVFGHEIDDPHHYHVAARGDVTVTVPEGQMLLLDVSGSVAKHPHCLREFSANAIECVRSVSVFSMDENMQVQASFQDQFLEDLSGLQSLERLNVARSDLTDKGVAYIQKMPRLNSVSIFECGVIRGDTIKALLTCPNLQYLDIGDCTAFKMKNLSVLTKLPKLEELQATNANMSDESLQYLSQCKGLKILDLRRDKTVTDKGLRLLLSLKKLERLSIEETAVTTAGVKALAPLNLKFLNISAELVKSPADLAELKKALPGTTLKYRTGGKKPLGDINVYFRSR